MGSAIVSERVDRSLCFEVLLLCAYNVYDDNVFLMNLHFVIMEYPSLSLVLFFSI